MEQSFPIQEAIELLTIPHELIAWHKSIPGFEQEIAKILNYLYLPFIPIPVQVLFTCLFPILIFVVVSNYQGVKKINPEKIEFPFSEESEALLARLNIDIEKRDSEILRKLGKQADRLLNRRECRHAFFLGLYKNGINLEKLNIEYILLEAELMDPVARNIP